MPDAVPRGYGVTALHPSEHPWNCAQVFEPQAPSTTPNPLADPTMSSGKALLFELEAKFAKDVLARGGAGFADWFADDGVALGNGAA